MGALLFACSSAAGAALAWLIARGEPSRLLVAAVNGLACALLGMVMATSRGGMAPLTQAGFGFLSAVAPLTLCTAVGPVTNVSGAVRRVGLTLALALAYGIGCAGVGFAVVYGIRHPPHKNYVSEAADSSVVHS